MELIRQDRMKLLVGMGWRDGIKIAVRCKVKGRAKEFVGFRTLFGHLIVQGKIA